MKWVPVKYETKSKWKERKRNETKQRATKRNLPKQNETKQKFPKQNLPKRNETKPNKTVLFPLIFHILMKYTAIRFFQPNSNCC
jgi:hypothetical protein